MKRKTLLVILGAITCMVPITRWVSADPQPVKYTSLQITADKISWNQTESRATLAGNVVMIHGETKMTAGRVIYNKSQKTAQATENPHVIDTTTQITGDSINANFGEKLAVVRGNVCMISTPKKTAKESLTSKWNDLLTLHSDELKYYYKQKRMEAEGNLKITQKDRTATAEKALYDETNEVVTLLGNVKCVDSKGQSFEGPKVTISLKEGNDWIEAEKGKAQFQIEENE